MRSPDAPPPCLRGQAAERADTDLGFRARLPVSWVVARPRVIDPGGPGPRGRPATVYSDILDGGTGRVRCQLIVVDGPDRGRACRLAQGAATIGTDAACELTLSDD